LQNPTETPIFVRKKSNIMIRKDYTYYRNCFIALHTARLRGFMAPHKPLLLLSILDLVESGRITTPRIYLTDELQRDFKANTERYIGHSLLFTPNIGQPFYHMQHEPFWTLVLQPGATVPSRPSYTVKHLQSTYRYALIDDDLFALMQNPEARAQLRVALISTYFSTLPSSMVPAIAVPLCGMMMGWIA
jgi:putative restriction endonuclease